MDFRSRISLYRMKNAMMLANFISNAIGVGIVLFLSRGAPERVESLSRHVSMGFIPMAFLLPLIATVLYERPMRYYWDAVYRNETVPEEKVSRSHRRLLNEPYFLIAVDMAIWLIATALYPTVFWFYDVDRGFVQQALLSNLTTGLITTTVAFFVLEFVLRRRVIPSAFPAMSLSGLLTANPSLTWFIGISLWSKHQTSVSPNACS